MSTIKVEKIQHPNAASVALTLDTSGYLALQAGSASTPAIQGPSDPNTGIFFPAADTIAFAEGGTEVLRIDSSGRVGLGTTIPQGLLTLVRGAGNVAPTSVTGANSFINIGHTEYGAASNGKYMVSFGYFSGGTNAPAYIGLEQTATGSYTCGDLTFYTRSVTTDTAPTERLRITNDGKLGVNVSSPGFAIDVSGYTGIRMEDGASGSVLAFNKSGSGTAFIANRSYGFHDGTGLGIATQTSTPIRFAIDNSERARIDTSGRLLVGTTSSQCAVGTLKSVDTNSIGHFQTFAFYKGGLGQNPTNTNIIAVTLPNSTGISVTIMLNVRLTAYQNIDQGGERSATYCINLLRISANGGSASNAVQANVSQIGSDIVTSVGSYSVGSLTVSVDAGSSSTGSVTAYIRVSGTSTSGASDTRVYMSGYSIGSPNNQPTIAAA